MKVRFGVSLGSDTGPAGLADIVDGLESAGVDSLWLPELVYSDSVEPFVGMAYALSRTARLKVGTSVAILPGRHPVLVGKQLVSLAALAPRRVLPVFGLQSALPGERELFAVAGGSRAAVFDESLRLLRSVLDHDDVTFAGTFFDVRGARIGPRPAAPLDIWLGGSALAALRRVGRLADGWLGSFLTPAEAGRARVAIQDAAAAAGRAIDVDHFGINLIVADDGMPDELADAVRRRRPDADPGSLVAGDWPRLHRLLDGYLDAGLTKFVVRNGGRRPAAEFLDRFVAELLPRQT
jgi:probable F420-dependent oxidoreductase